MKDEGGGKGKGERGREGRGEMKGGDGRENRGEIKRERGGMRNEKGRQ